MTRSVCEYTSKATAASEGGLVEHEAYFHSFSHHSFQLCAHLQGLRRATEHLYQSDYIIQSFVLCFTNKRED